MRFYFAIGGVWNGIENWYYLKKTWRGIPEHKRCLRCLNKNAEIVKQSRARKIVASWPKWKQDIIGILRTNSTSPKRKEIK